MKILVIGATGTLGQVIVKDLKQDHQVVSVGFSRGDAKVDITSSNSIAALYQQHADADAVVSAVAGSIVFKPLVEMVRDDYIESAQGKLLGQIDLVLQGLKYLKGHVSYTLTSGLLNVDPIPSCTAAAVINGALESFVRSAAIDMPGKQRINVITPALLEESVKQYDGFFPGYKPVSGKVVALAYRKMIMGAQTGQRVEAF